MTNSKEQGRDHARKSINKGDESKQKVKKFFRNNMFKILLGTSIIGGGIYGGTKIVENLKNKNDDTTELVVDDKKEKETEKTNLNIKPLDLEYKELNKEKKVKINYPKNQYSVEGRITRCLRWISITDAVEDRYGIPRGLLMALMAQEGRGDPTVINQGDYFEYIGKNKGNYQRIVKGTKKNGKPIYEYKKVKNGTGDSDQFTCDGGAGLIHMQAKNASDLGLKTMKRFNENMRDGRHGRLLEDAKNQYKDNLSELSKLDDRFNTVLSVDASARYLVEMHNKYGGTGTDSWIIAAEKYAGRKLEDYGYPVVLFWTVTNNIRGNKMPEFSKNINEVVQGKAAAKVNGKYENTKNSTEKVNNWINNSIIILDNDTVTTQEYYKYMKSQCENYGLNDYINFDKKHPYNK